MIVNPVLERLKSEDWEFKAILGYMASLKLT